MRGGISHVAHEGGLGAGSSHTARGQGGQCQGGSSLGLGLSATGLSPVGFGIGGALAAAQLGLNLRAKLNLGGAPSSFNVNYDPSTAGDTYF